MNADKKTTGAWDAEPTFGKADGKAQSKWSRLLRISLAACAIGAGFYAWSAPRTPCHGIPNKIDLQVKASIRARELVSIFLCLCLVIALFEITTHEVFTYSDKSPLVVRLWRPEILHRNHIVVLRLRARRDLEHHSLYRKHQD